MDLLEFERLYHSMFNKLCNKAYRYTFDREAAMDIVQDVFFRFWEKRDTLKLQIPEAYLHKSVVNGALNYLDKKKRAKIEGDESAAAGQPDRDTPEGIVGFEELEQKINKLISQLPPKCREVFLLSRYEEMTYKEIAIFLNISENTVDNHIKKALNILRKAILKLILFFT